MSSLKVEQLVKDYNNLTLSEQADFKKQLRVKKINHCKHYNVYWSGREQTYICRDCTERGVTTANDRWKG